MYILLNNRTSKWLISILASVWLVLGLFCIFTKSVIMFPHDKKCNNQTCINLGFILQHGLFGRSFFTDKERKLVRKLSYWSKYKQHLVTFTSIWNKSVTGRWRNISLLEKMYQTLPSALHLLIQLIALGRFSKLSKVKQRCSWAAMVRTKSRESTNTQRQQMRSKTD